MRRFSSCAVAWVAVSFGIPISGAQDPGTPFPRRNPIVEAVSKTRSAVVLIRVPRPDSAKDKIGSGVVVTECGYIVTNCHVVGSSDHVKIGFHDNWEATAQVIVAESSNDLALLKMDAKKPLFVLKPAAANDLLIGEQVVAVGNPLGYTHTVSTGIISAVNREITMPSGDVLRGLIQTDASINPGNSGGPLLNINGEFIGVNVALRQDAQGIAFAINAGTVDRFLKHHLSAAKVAGVEHGLKCGVKALTETGAGRQRVVIDQTLAQGNLRPGDEILTVAERSVATTFDVERALWDKRPGQHVTLRVVRQGLKLNVTLTLAASPGAGTSTARSASPAPPPVAVAPGNVSAGGNR